MDEKAISNRVARTLESNLNLAKQVVAGNSIDIKKELADAYMNIGRNAFKSLKKPRGVETVSALRERNRSNNTFSFVQDFEGYTRGDLEAKATVSLVMYADGEVFVATYGSRPDWKIGRIQVLDERLNLEIPVGKMQEALDLIFG